MPETAMLMTEKQAAERLGVKPRTMRTLRQTGAIGWVPVANKPMYSDQQLHDYIANQEVAPCRDRTEGPTSSGSQSAGGTMFANTSKVEPGTKARAQATAAKLKRSSRTSCNDGAGAAARVLPMPTR